VDGTARQHSRLDQEKRKVAGRTNSQYRIADQRHGIAGHQHAVVRRRGWCQPDVPRLGQKDGHRCRRDPVAGSDDRFPGYLHKGRAPVHRGGRADWRWGEYRGPRASGGGTNHRSRTRKTVTPTTEWPRVRCSRSWLANGSFAVGARDRKKIGPSAGFELGSGCFSCTPYAQIVGHSDMRKKRRYGK
jgi:hypothetical protein